ncbi:MAG: bifunctional nuclease domain-containing protein [Saprospiraceae bacterium]
MEKIELYIVTLTHSVTQSSNYAVVMGEVDGNRRLPIVIGGFEAQAIAVAMEGMVPSRPLTHDLLKNTLDTFEIEVTEILINNLVEGVFHARIVCMQHSREFEIDSRTSDAIAMAVRYGCPIYTYDFILDAAGVRIEDPQPGESEEIKEEQKPKRRRRGYAEYSVDDLTAMLEKVIGEEDYEKAAKIRDEINKRKEEGNS